MRFIEGDDLAEYLCGYSGRPALRGAVRSMFKSSLFSNAILLAVLIVYLGNILYCGKEMSGTEQ